MEKILKENREGQKELVATLAEALRAKTETPPPAGTAAASSGQLGDERISVLTGFDFKIELPKLTDNDPAFDEHWARYESLICTNSFNRGKIPKPYDILELYRKCLPVGSVRLKIYETIIKRRQRKKVLGDGNHR